MTIHPEALFLIQALIIIVLPLLLWKPKIIQAIAPLVMVQILVGILLGPTIIGHFFPDFYTTIFPKASLVNLNGLSWLGLSLLGFLTGLHFDIRSLRHKGRAFLATSLGTLLIPLGLGIVLALNFYHVPFTGTDTVKWIYVMGVAVAIAVTALPVLSAMLLELKLIDTALGKRVLGYAIVNDITLWIALALLTAVSANGHPHSYWHSIGLTVVIALAFIVFMFTAARKFLQHLSDKGILVEQPSTMQLVLVMGGILLSGLVTESIGIHYLLGAFVFGSVMPKSISHGLYKHMEQFTMVVLMPFFFVLTGLKTSLSFGSGEVWLLFLFATLAAILGKTIGTAVPEYLFFKSRASVAIKAGSLMQTKGLMEVVVLNILLSAKIINTTVFSALVLMAVTTTLLTKPFLSLINRFSVKRQSTT
jgi:Kef-type K+ transport system membrane component KefB